MQSILENKVSQELLDLLISIEKVLTDGGYVHHITTIDNYKMKCDNLDPIVVVDDVVNILKDAIDEVMKRFEVKISDETPFNVCFFILDFLFNFKSIENYEEIEDIVAAGEDTKEIFIDILSLLSPVDTNDLFVYLESVSKPLIESIVSAARSVSAEEDFVPVKMSDVPLTVLKEAGSITLEAMSSRAIPKGIPIDTYVESYEFISQSLISEGSVAERVKNAYDLCVYSGLSSEEILSFLPNFLSPYMDSLRQSIEIKKHILLIQAEYNEQKRSLSDCS